MDIIVEVGGKLIPIEVKLSATPKPATTEASAKFQRDLGVKVEDGRRVNIKLI